jgi:hypothetical protein
MRICVAVAAFVSAMSPIAYAAETIGPANMLCREVNAGPGEKTAAIVMWAVGYITGENNLSSADFLKGREMEGIIESFRDVCLDRPDKTVLVAARDVVARLRFETALRLQNSN